MDIIGLIISWQFLFIALAISAFTGVIRTVVEASSKDVVNSRLWKSVTLPILPILLGLIVGGFASDFTFPEGMDSLSGRLMFCCVAGLFSTKVYRLVKTGLQSLIKK